MAEEREGGNFVGGLVLGTLAGLAGMFLFGTKKGNKTLEKLKTKWEKVKPQVERELEIKGHQLEKSKKPFLQSVGEIVEYIAETLEESNKPKKKSSPQQKALPASASSFSGPSHTKKVFFKKK